MDPNEKPPAAGGGARAQFGSARKRNSPDFIPSDFDKQGRARPPLERWRMKACRSISPGYYRAALIIGVLPVAVDRIGHETHAGNSWFAEQTGMTDRAITYALNDLAEAGLIVKSSSGPRRKIKLLIPDGSSEKPAYAVQASEQAKPADGMRASEKALPAHGGRLARTRCAEIGGRKLPLPPQASASRRSSESESAARQRVFTLLGNGSADVGREVAAGLPRSQVQRWINAERLGALDEHMIREIEAARPSRREPLIMAAEAGRGDTPAGNARVEQKIEPDDTMRPPSPPPKEN